MPAAGVALGVGGLALGAYSSYEQGKAADKAASRADSSIQLQTQVANRQLDLSEKQFGLGVTQWETYKNKILPLELDAQKLGLSAQQLAVERGGTDLKLYQDYYAPLQEQFVTAAQEGIKPQYDRVAREARTAVDTNFDSAQATQRRELERRGVRPGAPGYAMSDTSLARGATSALATTEARQRERDRVERENFNRMAVALGRQPTAANPIQSSTPGVTPVTAGYSMNGGAAGAASAGNTAQGAGAQSAYMANAYGANAGNAAMGGIQLGMQAYDLYNRYAQPAAPQTVQPTGNTSYSPNYMSTNPWANPMIGGPNQAFAEGGPVPELSRGEPPGTVQGPPGTDQAQATIVNRDGSETPARLTAGEIVIPRDVVMRKGTEFFDKLLESGKQRKEARGRHEYGLGRTH